jgi:hypothetical protein
VDADCAWATKTESSKAARKGKKKKVTKAKQKFLHKRRAHVRTDARLWVILRAKNMDGFARARCFYYMSLKGVTFIDDIVSLVKIALVSPLLKFYSVF